jgi:hypothetical protein
MLTPLGPMEKSGFETALTITDTAVACDNVPLTPETITV